MKIPLQWPRSCSYFHPHPLRQELLEKSRRYYAELQRAGVEHTHVVYRRVGLKDGHADELPNVTGPGQPYSPIGMDAFLLISAVGAPHRAIRLNPGYRREEYDSFDDAVRAAQMPMAEYAIERWRRELVREHEGRVRRQRDARKAKFGRAETLEERNTRHRNARAASGLSANAYARQHDGADGLSAHQLRRIVSQRAAQKTRPRQKRDT